MTVAIRNTVIGCSVAAVLGLVSTLHPNELHTSQAGLELLSGYEDCRLSAYKDSIGVPTIGIGATKSVCMGQVISLEEAAAMFVRDVKEAEQCVITHFNGKAMPQPVFDSTVSLVYNNGCYGTRWNKKANRPTFIARYAVSGDWYNVCYRLGDFINAGGKPSNGLKNRRAKEQTHCLLYRTSTNGL
ncbi:prophage lysozyme; Phage lysin [Yersinia phage phiR8-01]|uniref:Endolysin n=1 Tax=Yersinia phage phiR8-01 TaxID=1206556 RepID=A0A1K2IXT0_9CAUD|nr:endolysin [Yersinia phage phiR8-01]SGA03419.1 prophage lysozyme; Phage lysin [Yersinia phage phiR8-01]